MSSGHVISVYTCWAGVCTPAREYIFAGVCVHLHMPMHAGK